MTRRWGVPAALAMAAALVGAGPAAAKIGSCDDPILLGTTISETGPFSTLTDNWKKMTEIFFEEINAAGGVYVEACKKKLPVKIVIYDDQSNPSTATSLFCLLYTSDAADE